MDNDNRLIAFIQARANNPATRTDVEASSPSTARQPATPEMIEATEARLGFPLHPFLKRLYTEVANGGFGPGYGLAGLAGGNDDAERETLAKRYQDFRTEESPNGDQWPAGLLPLWDWGDAIWSCLDANSPEGTIVTHDDVDGPTVTDFTVRSWLEAWAQGVDLWKEIYEDRDATIINPFTKKPVLTKVRGIAKGRKM